MTIPRNLRLPLPLHEKLRSNDSGRRSAVVDAFLNCAEQAVRYACTDRPEISIFDADRHRLLSGAAIFPPKYSCFGFNAAIREFKRGMAVQRFDPDSKLWQPDTYTVRCALSAELYDNFMVANFPQHKRDQQFLVNALTNMLIFCQWHNMHDCFATTPLMQVRSCQAAAKDLDYFLSFVTTTSTFGLKDAVDLAEVKPCDEGRYGFILNLEACFFYGWTAAWKEIGLGSCIVAEEALDLVKDLRLAC